MKPGSASGRWLATRFLECRILLIGGWSRHSHCIGGTVSSRRDMRTLEIYKWERELSSRNVFTSRTYRIKSSAVQTNCQSDLICWFMNHSEQVRDVNWNECHLNVFWKCKSNGDTVCVSCEKFVIPREIKHAFCEFQRVVAWKLYENHFFV